MDELQVKETKKLEWLKQGGSEQDLDNLGLLVKGMANKAMADNVAYKEVDSGDALGDLVAPVGAGEAQPVPVEVKEDTQPEAAIVAEDQPEGQTNDSDGEAVQEITNSDSETSESEADAGATESVEETNVEPVDEPSADVDENMPTMDALDAGAVGKALEVAITSALDAYHEAVVVPMLAEMKEFSVAIKSRNTSTMDFALDELPIAALASTIKERYGSVSEVVGETVDDAEVDAKEIKEFNTEPMHMLAGL